MTDYYDWRQHALAIVCLREESCPEQRKNAWRFLKQHGVKQP